MCVGGVVLVLFGRVFVGRSVGFVFRWGFVGLVLFLLGSVGCLWWFRIVVRGSCCRGVCVGFSRLWFGFVGLVGVWFFVGRCLLGTLCSRVLVGLC